jgi:hypothetical protein
MNSIYAKIYEFENIFKEKYYNIYINDKILKYINDGGNDYNLKFMLDDANTIVNLKEFYNLYKTDNNKLYFIIDNNKLYLTIDKNASGVLLITNNEIDALVWNL